MAAPASKPMLTSARPAPKIRRAQPPPQAHSIRSPGRTDPRPVTADHPAKPGSAAPGPGPGHVLGTAACASRLPGKPGPQDMTDFAGSAQVSGHFSQRQQDHD
jgi:hypothetical protein